MNDPQLPPTSELARLVQIVAHLRNPDGGCPWDLKQSEQTMAPHLLEETYEALEAIRSGDDSHAAEELGDVLMNVAMIAQIASERGAYDLEDVARGIADKLVRRHPHVFGEVQADDAETVLRNWEQIKRSEKGDTEPPKRVLDGLPADLPALLKAYRCGEKAARVGFDWPDAKGPRAKLDEELAEFDEALESGDKAAIEAEFGDVLFSLVNCARHHGLHPEMALHATIAKFRHRFEHVEDALGDRLGKASLEEMETLWDQAKSTER